MNQKSINCVSTLTKFAVFFSVIFSLYQPAAVAGGTQFSCKTDTTEDGIIVPATIAKTEKGTETSIILWICHIAPKCQSLSSVRSTSEITTNCLFRKATLSD